MHSARPPPRLARLPEFVQVEFEWMTAELMSLAETHCEGRLISLLEGGCEGRLLEATTLGMVVVALGAAGVAGVARVAMVATVAVVAVVAVVVVAVCMVDYLRGKRICSRAFCT
eukprot:6207646-Pleurochrysis_carterae.AAC.1